MPAPALCSPGQALSTSRGGSVDLVHMHIALREGNLDPGFGEAALDGGVDAVLDGAGGGVVLDAEGGLVRSTAQVATGDTVETRLSDGSFTSRVEATGSRRPASRNRIKN